MTAERLLRLLSLFTVRRCWGGERLRFGYTDSRGTASSRHVEPYRLVFTARHWYLVARDLGKGDWRSFTPLEPPELRERCAALSRRLGEAAGAGEPAGSVLDDLLPAEEARGQSRAGERAAAEHE